MQSITESDFTQSFFPLLKETFEGPAATGPSAFLNKGTALFQTLEGVSGETASAKSRPSGSTIAAHTEHVRFYIEAHHKLLLGSTEEIDWDYSWRIKTVSSAQWDDLRKELRRAYQAVVDHLRAIDSWREETISLAMAIVAHSGYHLGAIRQLILAVTSPAT